MSILWIFPLLSVLAFTQAKTPASPEDLSSWTRGVIQKVELEGGFFGIFTEEGQKLLPTHLPEKFKQSGMEVRFRYRELKNVVSIRMWGKSVVISEIEEVESLNPGPTPEE